MLVPAVPASLVASEPLTGVEAFAVLAPTVSDPAAVIDAPLMGVEALAEFEPAARRGVVPLGSGLSLLLGRRSLDHGLKRFVRLFSVEMYIPFSLTWVARDSGGRALGDRLCANDRQPGTAG